VPCDGQRCIKVFSPSIEAYVVRFQGGGHANSTFDRAKEHMCLASEVLWSLAEKLTPKQRQ